MPALSKAWTQWAAEQRAKERTLEQAERFEYYSNSALFFVPPWLAQQHPGLSDEQKRRFQQRAVVHGDVDAASLFDSLFDTRLCTFAARSGQLAALQQLRALGCAWNFQTCTAAAQGGYLAVLQWARANGYPETTTMIEGGLSLGRATQ